MTSQDSSPHPYRDWPYATDYVQKTLDPLAIDKHARLILARALNVGRVIAFVGAGSSMSYGRISWKELVEAEADFVEAKAKKFCELEGNCAAKARANLLLQRLKSLKAPENVQPDKYSVIYQVAEELDRALSQSIVSSSGTGMESGHSQSPTDPAEIETSRDRTSALVADDRGHAIRILKSATKSVSSAITDPRFRTLESVKHPFVYRKYFTRESLGKLITIAGSHISSEDAFLTQLIKAIGNFGDVDHRKFRGHTFLYASQRHRIGAMLALLANLDKTPSDEIHSELAEWWGLSAAEGKSEHNTFRVKRELLVPPMRDPLALLVENLKIRRFITTNYDQEIERLHRDLDFRMVSRQAPGTSGADTSAPSLLHPAFTELVFDPQQANALAAFAARDRSPAGVVHLHGRVSSAYESGTSKPKFEHSVLTERDYQLLYLDQKGDTQTDDALNVAFGGNPLLFVGSGMGEDDILRPMREFMSGSTTLGDRTAIALMPGLDNDKKRDAGRVTLLNRYGVYTIYFGDVSYTDEPECGNEQTRPLWLNLFNELHDKLKAFFDAIEKADGAVPAEFLAKRQALEKWIKDTKISRPFFWADGTAPRLRAPNLVEGVNIDLSADFCLKAEVELINCALDYALLDASDWVNPGRKRAAHALSMLISGAKDSAITACLCAALVRLRNDWTEWKSNWYELPAVRWFNYTPVDQPCKYGSGNTLAVSRRHAPAIGLQTDQRSPPVSRFYAGVVSQSLIALIQSLGSPQTSATSSPSSPGGSFTQRLGRRTLLLLAKPGAGQGHLFMSLAGAPKQSNPNLDKFLAALGGGAQKWSAAGFYNFDLSREVMSVFDNIAAMLDDASGQPSAPPSDVQRNRLEWLRRALHAFQLKSDEREQNGQIRPRILLVLNGVDALFDKHGTPKNGEIRQVFDTLMNDSYDRAPIDIVLIIRENHIPQSIRGKPYLALNVREPDDQAHNSTHAAAEDRRRLVNAMGGDSFSQSKNGSTAPMLISSLHTAAHIVRPAQAATFASVYFPAVCIAYAIRLWAQRTEWKAHDLPLILNSEFTQAAFNVLEKDHSNNLNVARTIFPLSIIFTAGQIISNSQRLNPSQFTSGLLLHYFKYCCQLLLQRLEHHKYKINTESLIDDKQIMELINKSDVSPEKFKAIWAEYDRTMRELYQASGRQRFALTLIFSKLESAGRLHDSIAKILIDDPNKFKSSDQLTIAELTRLRSRAVENVDSAVQEILRQVKGLPRGHVTDAILDNLLPTLERRKSWRFRKEGGIDRLVNEPCLTTELIWHLAIIGQPVEQDVILVCPRMRGAAKRALTGSEFRNKVTDTDIDAVLVDALRFAVEHCLVFEIYNGSPDGNAVSTRYCVHRATQKYVFQKLGAPHVDVIEAEHFAPSLYGAQTEDLPKLKPEAHRQVLECFDALCGYPNGKDEVDSFNSLFDPNETSGSGQGSSTGTERIKASQRLRAAYGIIRAIYSVAVLARFDSDFDAQSPGDGKEGHFEALRLRIRWILRQAQRLGADHSRSGSTNPRLPFYDEEIVWLYNECGLLSFVQGQLNDADALFGQALEAAKRIEPNDTGVLHQRVILNHAQVAIERGRTGEAEAALRRIRGNLRKPRDEGGGVAIPAPQRPEHAVGLIAEGYIGLIKNLAGEFDSAERCYLTAIRGLLDIGVLRGASIFCRHYSAMLANQKRTELADRFEADAIHLAQKGGHEDIRQMAELARTRRRIMRLTTEKGSPLDASIHRELDVIERYGHMVGMPRLICEVYQGRAQLLQAHGEVELAGRFAARSLEIASMNNLRLRKILSLILLASINKDRGKDFLPVLHLGIDLAKNSRHSLHLERAHRILGSVTN